ncbi:hypothetical protein BDV25DRAFT_155319 [Aspergillus avenaceus]|uniref:GMC oxidoreductase n=1 Tax=Aspergillus avenaceus TaxID=36643 RepID=A0A5N6TUD3_ASPAV|nr:hypothetical protein BDV25DRAFT_155319 [Aspergillus avenaceus]
MMRILQLLSHLSIVATASAQRGSHINLFDYGQPGSLLGTSFGVPGDNATFDYVIVGGGTAGLTIANRLAQGNSDLSIAVVEAGGFYEIDNGNLSIVPGYTTSFTGWSPDDYQPLVDWGLATKPQAAAGNRAHHYPRGKTLGGSSARNFMVYQRPTVGSMQKWADEVKDQSYTFANMLPFFQKSPHYTPPDNNAYADGSNTEAEDAFSRSGGPLEVSFSNHVDAFGTYAREAYIAVGMDQIDGFNSGKLLGSAYATSTINPRNAHRSSSETSFLQAALHRVSNLRVYKNTLGQKILFNSDRVATGVQVSTGGTFGTGSVKFTLNARKEVIVSAGVFQSPQLLMVSGIGSCHELSEFDIPCIHNLPGVGKNMQDHMMFGPAHRVNIPTASAAINNQTLAAQLAQQYLESASGPLSVFGSGYYGWEKLPEPYRSRLSERSIQALSAVPDDWPEIEWLTVNAFTGDGSNKGTDPMDGYNYATISAGIIAPQSRGTVSLAGPDMNTLPIVDPQWFSDPTDMEVSVQGFKRSRQIWGKLVEMGIAHPEEYFPGANVTTDEQIRDFIRETSTTIYHASCTCKMGQEEDRMAVVDSSARVYGVQGVRVVDASSFPFLTPGHPQALVYAFAEKIADEILNTL